MTQRQLKQQLNLEADFMPPVLIKTPLVCEMIK
jgi:hypothetical protein